ncbi:hypothetical protein ACROYT_G002861 [Oculina patagonica]
MAQSGLILVPLLLLSFVTIGQCISSAICTMDTDIRYHATKGRPLGAKWGPDLQQTVVGFETPDRKEDCRNICERKCRGLGSVNISKLQIFRRVPKRTLNYGSEWIDSRPSPAAVLCDYWTMHIFSNMHYGH